MVRLSERVGKVGNISESVAGSGINMAGLRTLFLNSVGYYTGPLPLLPARCSSANSLALQNSTLNYNNQGGRAQLWHAHQRNLWGIVGRSKHGFSQRLLSLPCTYRRQ